MMYLIARQHNAFSTTATTVAEASSTVSIYHIRRQSYAFVTAKASTTTS